MPGRFGDAPTTPAAACTFCARISRDDVAGRQAALRDLLRIEPHAHRIVAAAEQLHLTDAGEYARADP